MNITVAQAVVGILVIGGAIAYSLIELLRGENAVPPDWLTLSVGAVIGYFFANNSQQVTALIQQRTAQTTVDSINKVGTNSNGKSVGDHS